MGVGAVNASALLRLLAPLALALALLAIPAVALRLAPATLARAADAADAERFFHRLDRLEQNAERTFRWSLGRWSLGLYGLERSAPIALRLQLSATRPAEEPEATLNVQGNGAAGTFSVAREWRTYHLLAEPATGDAGVRSISFDGSVFVPAGERGDRALGVAVHAMQARLLSGGLNIEPRALFLTTLALLAGLSVYVAGMRTAPAAVIALLAACSLAGGTMIAPAILGYWLPNLWFFALLWGAALLVIAIRQRGITLPAGRRPLIAAGVALIGAMALWLGAPAWIGLPLLIGGALAAAAPTAPVATRDEAVGRREVLLLGGITLAALVLRLGLINELPPALWRDEARHGIFALLIWQTDWYRPVYEPAVDLPALILYLIAPLAGIFGPDLWTLRGGVAFVGALAPAALWLALRPLFGMRVALLGAALLAASLWAIYMSRWAMPPILDVTCTLAAIGLALRALRLDAPIPRAALYGTLAGACAGLALYTYHTGRLAPLVVLFIAAVAYAGARRPARSQAVALGAGILALLLVATPLIGYALGNTELFSRRVDRVGVLRTTTGAPTPPAALLQQNVLRYTLMWHVEGDYNARHYAPYRPMLDPASGALFAVGLGAALLQSERRRLLLLLGWLALGLAPGVLSGDAPHAMRSIGALAPAITLAALGLDRLLTQAGGRRAALAAALGIALVWNPAVYFSATTDERAVFDKFDADETYIGRAARIAIRTADPVAPYRIYLYEATAVKNVTTFLTSDVMVGVFDGAQFSPPPGERALLLLPGEATAEEEARALELLGAGARLLRTGPLRPDIDAPIYRVYGVGPEAEAEAARLRLP
jgi:4-amino-4-deoxy-L-arabinose transferase-like glycosyltransferase